MYHDDFLSKKKMWLTLINGSIIVYHGISKLPTGPNGLEGTKTRLEVFGESHTVQTIQMQMILGDTHAVTFLLCSRIAFDSIRRDCQNSRQTARAAGCLCAGTCNTTAGAYRSTWTCTKSTRLWRGARSLTKKRKKTRKRKVLWFGKVPKVSCTIHM